MVDSVSSSSARVRIFESAIPLIQKRDGAGISMAEIAKAAGISRQAVYLHFADRGQFLVELARHVDQKRGLQQALEPVLNAPSGLEALRRYVRLQAVMNPGVWPLARIFEAARRTDAEVELAWQDRLAARLRICTSITRRLADSPGLRPGITESVAADLMWSVTSLRMWEDMVLVRQWSERQYQRHVVHLLTTALLQQP